MVSVVILSYNRCTEVLFTISELVEMQKALPFEIEIIVVDNASVDDTSIQIGSMYPQVILLRREINVGIAGWNDGFEIAKHKYLLVLDDDSCIKSGLPEAIRYLDSNVSIGILALSIFDLNNEHYPKADPGNIIKDGDELPGFIGCGAIIRREVYEKIGGFSNWLLVYTHEYDYGIRCLNAGYKIEFSEKAVVIHRVTNMNRVKSNLRIYSTRNELAIVYSYFSTDRFKYILRVFFNNLKFVRREGIKAGYYVSIGFIKFLKVRKKLSVKPVRIDVQEFFARKYWSTKPVFYNLSKRFSKHV